jgi:hypothetical protein
VGQYLIPAGTTLDRADWQWNGVTLPWPVPANAMALDQEAYDELCRHHEPHRVLVPPYSEIKRKGA